MNTVVVYSSQTGFTKKYAEWIAEELGCEAVSLNDEPRFDAEGFDVVVLGGWFHAGGLMGKKWLVRQRAAHPNTRFVVFAVGATPTEWTDMVDEALTRELPSPDFDDVERFYLRGGFAYERLSTPNKLAMKPVSYTHLARHLYPPSRSSTTSRVSSTRSTTGLRLP